MEAGRTWERTGEEKRLAVRNMFAAIAPSYDRLNGLMSFSQDGAWRRAAIETLGLKPGGHALDVATGTGDFLSLLREKVGPGGRVVGSDFCLPMLERARPKTDAELTLADACALPFADESFDSVSVGWGIRNVPNIDLAHGEALLRCGNGLDRCEGEQNECSERGDDPTHRDLLVATSCRVAARNHEKERETIRRTLQIFAISLPDACR